MPRPARNHTPSVITAVVELTAAYVTRNRVGIAQLPDLIASLHATLQGIVLRAAVPLPESEPKKSGMAFPVKVTESITSGALISLIDGRPYKILKRHLTAHGLTPDAYRKRYGLPVDYPMVSPDYAARRAVIAREMRLGNWSRSRKKKHD